MNSFFVMMPLNLPAGRAFGSAEPTPSIPAPTMNGIFVVVLARVLSVAFLMFVFLISFWSNEKLSFDQAQHQIW